MLKCCNCGKIFDEGDAKYVRELVGEFWGAPAYETWLHCPECDSDEVTTVDECKRCEATECEFRIQDEEGEDDKSTDNR